MISKKHPVFFVVFCGIAGRGEETELLLEEERKLNCCSLLKTELLLEEERKLNCVHTVPGRSKQTPIRS